MAFIGIELVTNLTPWIKVFIEKPLASHTVKVYPAFYIARKFIRMLQIVRY
jgi:hypothetical protein